MIVEATDDGVLVRRLTITDEIDADYAAGRFESDEAFVARLRSLVADDASGALVPTYDLTARFEPSFDV